MQRSHIFALIAVGAWSSSARPEGLYRFAVRPTSEKAASPRASGESGRALYEPSAGKPVEGPGRVAGADPVVIADCRISVIDKQDVPSQRDGVLLFVGREVRPGEVVPEERLVTVEIGGKVVKIRRWKEGDRVLPGELLAQLDDRLPRDERAIKQARVAAAQADFAAAERAREEASRVTTGRSGSGQRAAGRRRRS